MPMPIYYFPKQFYIMFYYYVSLFFPMQQKNLSRILEWRCDDVIDDHYHYIYLTPLLQFNNDTGKKIAFFFVVVICSLRYYGTHTATMHTRLYPSPCRTRRTLLRIFSHRHHHPHLIINPFCYLICMENKKVTLVSHL